MQENVKSITIYLTKQEYEMLRKEAQQEGMLWSAYLHKLVMLGHEKAGRK